MCKLFTASALVLSLCTFTFTQAGAQPGSEASAAPMAAPDFITAASQSDEFEVQEGQLAQSMAKNARVKRFGAKMVHDHSMTTENLHKAIMKAGMSVPPPPPLRADQQQMVSQLQGMSGTDFDKTYVDQQVGAHQEALMVMMGYGKSGDVKELRAAAKKTAPLVKMHLGMLQEMQGMMSK